MLRARRGGLAGVSRYIGLCLGVSGQGEERRKNETNHDLHRGSLSLRTSRASRFLGSPRRYPFVVVLLLSCCGGGSPLLL